MPDKSWKKFEREIANQLGGYRRLRHTGEPGPDPGDVIGARLPYADVGIFVECKYRASMPVVKWFKSTQEKAAGGVYFPVLFLREKGDPEAYAVMPLGQLTTFLKMAELVGSGKAGIIGDESTQGGTDIRG